MGKRVFTKKELDDLGLPYDCGGFEGSAEELHGEQIDTLRWISVHELVFRAPDDGKAYRVTYEEGLTENQETRPWGYQNEVTAIEVRPHEVTTIQWRTV